MPKMIKIGEVRVLNHFDLPWTQPIGDVLPSQTAVHPWVAVSPAARDQIFFQLESKGDDNLGSWLALGVSMGGKERNGKCKECSN